VRHSGAGAVSGSNRTSAMTTATGSGVGVIDKTVLAIRAAAVAACSPRGAPPGQLMPALVPALRSRSSGAAAALPHMPAASVAPSS
jgi:hypothetical protein